MLYINKLDYSSFERSWQPANSTSHSNQLEIIMSSQDAAHKIDNSLSIMPIQSDSEILAMVAIQQKAIVQAIMGINSNPEKAIAQALFNSIDIYAQKLALIEGWTNGGVEMFRSSIALMFEELKAKGNSSEVLYREDLFQLALLEVMCNSSEYGLDGWYEINKTDISHVLESTGSGSHSIHESGWDTPQRMANVVGKLYDGILTNGNIPPDSLLGQIMGELEASGGKAALQNDISKNWTDPAGFWVVTINGSSPSANISPMLRLFLLSSLLEEQPDMTKESVEIILTGSLKEIDDLVVSDFGGNASPGQYYTPSLRWLTDHTSWQVQDKTSSHNGGHTHQLDWVGSGIDIKDLNNLYSKFPGRNLTQEEIEEINRIGDQVKMIQETLKYWINLVKEEQLAMVRNIT